MALTSFKDEDWAQDPLSVTSYLSFSTQKFQRCSGASYSPRCGMGWRFFVSWSSLPPGRRKVLLQFDPYFLKAFPQQNLTLMIKCDQTLVGSPAHQISSLSHGAVLLKLQKAIDTDIEIHVLFQGRPTTFPSIAPAPPAQVLDLIAASVEGRDVIDIAFHLYHTRSRSKRLWVCPRAVYGSTILLRGQCFYLDTLLFDDDFKDPSVVDLSQIHSSINDYDYESDSDFESDSEDTYDSEGVSEEPSLVDNVIVDDSSRSDRQDPGPDTKSKQSSEAVVAENMNFPKEVAARPVEGNANRKQGRAVRSINLTTFAFRTWKAFILYLEVRELAFKPLRSQHPDCSEESKLACSPRSMYRLADMVGSEDLKNQAFSAIRSSITEENIIEELFSSFTFRYPEVRSFEIAFLLDHQNKLNEFYQKLSEGLFVEHQFVVAEVMRALGARAGESFL